MRIPKKLEGLAPRRKAAGMTQAQLAASIEVERAALAMWEIGASGPSARLLPALAEVLACSIDELYVAPDTSSAAQSAAPSPQGEGMRDGGPARAPAPTERTEVEP